MELPSFPHGSLLLRKTEQSALSANRKYVTQEAMHPPSTVVTYTPQPPCLRKAFSPLPLLVFTVTITLAGGSHSLTLGFSGCIHWV